MDLAIPSAISGVIALTSAFSGIKSLLGSKGFGLDGFVPKTFTASMFNGITSSAKNLFTTLKGGSSSAKAVGQTMEGIATSTTTVSKGMKVAQIATLAFDAVLKGLAIGLVVTAISAGAKAIYNYTHETEIAVKKSQEAIDSYQEDIASLNSKKTSLEGLSNEWNELTKKSKLSVQELERYNELKNEIAQIAPELVIGYDVNGDAILNLTNNMNDYIGSINEAISEKQRLINLEKQEQSEAYKSNDNKNGNGNKYSDKALSYYKNLTNDIKNNNGVVATSLGTAVKDYDKVAEKYVEIEKYKQASIKKVREEGQKDLEEYLKAEESIQAEYMSKYQDTDSYKNLAKNNSKNLETINSLGSTIDWTSIGNDADRLKLVKGLEELDDKIVVTTNKMGGYAKASKEALSSFKETGDIEKYGKALEDIAKNSGKYDSQSWAEYLNAINNELQYSGDIEAYQKNLKPLISTLSELMGVDASVLEKAFTIPAGALDNLDAYKVGLSDFLEANNRTVTQLQNGDKLSQVIKEQYDNLVNLNDELLNMDSTSITMDFLLDKSSGENLPSQIKALISHITSDKEVTEVEKKLLLSCTTEIENEGKLTDDTTDTLRKLFDGTMNLNSEVYIGGIKFSSSELKSLKKEFDESGESVDEFIKKLQNNDTSNLVKNLEEVEKALSKIKDTDVSDAIRKLGNVDGVEDVERLTKLLESIPEEERVDFISNFGQGIVDAESLDSAIKSLPDSVKVKYNIGVEGNAELEKLKEAYDSLPKNVQTKINLDTMGVEQIQIVKKLVDNLGEKRTLEIFAQMEGVEQALEECQTIEEFVNWLKSNNKQEIDVAVNSDELDSLEEDAEVSLEKEIKAILNKDELKKLDELTKTEEKEVNVKVNDEEATKKKEELKKDTESTHTTVYKEEGEKKETPKDTESTHTTKEKVEVEGKEKLEEANKEKEKLEKDGESNTTITVTGQEEVNQVRQEKLQLEKNGNANTDVSVNGEEKLESTKKAKDDLEKSGNSNTNISVTGQEEVDQARQEKIQLEKNGSGNTTLTVDDSQVKQAKEEAKNPVDIKVTFNVNDAIDNVLSRLGLNKKKETIDITINAIDNASKTLDKINKYQNKKIEFSINVKGGDVASSQVETISKTSISNKTFSIVCNGGDKASKDITTIANTTIANKSFTVSCNSGTVESQVRSIANIIIPNKSFSVTCNSGTVYAQVSSISAISIKNKSFVITCNDSATAKINSIRSATISNKKFFIVCTDNASSRISSINSKTIGNKKFTVSCVDNASYKLNSIISKLSAIRSKTVTVTTRQVTVSNGVQRGGGITIGTGNAEILEASASAMSREVQVMSDGLDNTLSKSNSMNKDIMASTKAVSSGVSTSKYWTNQALDHDIELLTNYINALKKINGLLDINASKQERAFGSSKAKLIQDEIKLLNNQSKLLKEQQARLKNISKNDKSYLSSKGFKFDKDGNFTNYASKLLEYEHAYEKAQKAVDNYKGKSESKKSSLEATAKKKQEELEKVKKALEEYSSVTFSELPSVEKEWNDVANSIRDAKNALYEANKEQANLYKEARVNELNYQYDKLSDKLDLLKTKMELSYNTNRVDILEEELKLIDEQKQETLKLQEALKSQQQYDKNYLKKKGFEFDKDGDITNGAIQLNRYSSNDEYESIKKAYEEYMDIQRDTLPDLTKQWYELLLEQEEIEQSIKDIQEAQDELARNKKYAVIDNLNNVANSLSSSIDLLESRLENAKGVNKIGVYEEELALLNKQLELQNQISSEYEKKVKDMKDSLSVEGFKFDDNGNIVNYEYILSLVKTQDEYDKLKEKVEEYTDARDDSLANSKKEYQETINAIQQAKDEILSLKQEMEELKDSARLTELENDLTAIENMIEKNESLSELQGADLVSLYQDRLNLIKQAQAETRKLLEYQKNEQKELADKLISYGFVINDDSSISNTDKKLESLKNTLSETEFDIVKETLDKYFDTTYNTINELENSLLDYRKEFEDVQKEKLDITKKVEDEITKIYKKQVEDRIEEIEKETKARTDSLNKSKEAYNKWRDEIDYKDEYNEQLTTVQDLQKKIEIAKMDTSLSGKKRFEDLMTQLTEEQKKLEKIVQDKIDEDINDNFDDEIDRVESESDKRIEELESVFDEKKIAEMVSNALKTGLFEDIDGNITSLNDALMDFANNSSDYLGVMGNSLKTELVDNLKVALSTMQEMKEVGDKLGFDGIKDFSNALSTINNIAPKGNQEYKDIIEKSVSDTIQKSMSIISEGNKVIDGNIISESLSKLLASQPQINVGDINLVIEGNGANINTEEIKRELDEMRNEIVEEIVKYTH